MNEPLYRLFGKLQSGCGRSRSLIYTKSYNKSCERLSYTHKTRLILPQDKGVSNIFANRIQDILLLVKDTYHTIHLFNIDNDDNNDDNNNMIIIIMMIYITI